MRLSLSSVMLLLAIALRVTGWSDDGVLELFDGKTLSHWSGEPGYWRVEDGAIVGQIPKGATLDHNTWLVWEGGELGDFDLRLQFQLSGAAAANSGIQFRCQAEGPRKVAGYQADLDKGAEWLGRIYDEEGRALLVERGSRVHIDENGARRVERFAEPTMYKVLFRDSTWNDYHIQARGAHVRVEINGTLFSELIDEQQAERDLTGKLAFQLHAGPETLVKFRNIELRSMNDAAFGVHFRQAIQEDVEEPEGTFPLSVEGKPLNFGFEKGTLEDWVATGDAFVGQPVEKDGIAERWNGQSSNKDGRFFIGGYELVKDQAKGTLTSAPFVVAKPFLVYRLGGGSFEATRVDCMLMNDDGSDGGVAHTASGADQEEMHRIVVDLRAYQGKAMRIRITDDASGGWGHLNVDDFRVYDALPSELNDARPQRLRENPLLQHLVPNPLGKTAVGPGADTVRSMFLESGFTVEVIAEEPGLVQPIAFTWDARGRLWVVEALSYPQKRPDGEGLDRVIILEDTNGDGGFDSRKVFAEGLNLVSGIEVGYGGVWIGAAPQLLFIPDADSDDQPDGAPVVLLDGFGYQDTHETLNSFIWGPDGWLYGNQGVFNESYIGKPGTAKDARTRLFAGVWRYHPVKHVFEVFAFGGSNQWGLDFDENGQLFMTHCRSHFGKGATTHVIQGGHYWNQANSNYAPFVSREAISGYPEMQNFMLASAPYGHGEGGAGAPGTARVFGGHSHVGTMLYLGDNWPDAFRNHLFTHNLHGHQINQQFNRRRGSGFETLHAGRDVLYCPDPKYVAVDLQYGPDGAVYAIDWVDPQHCHNPNEEQWDRSNGRLYRIAYAPTWKPVKVDLSARSDAELVTYLAHKNAWYGRTARRVLSERAMAKTLASSTVELLQRGGVSDLETLWTLHGLGGLTESLGVDALARGNDFMQCWAIQLLSEAGDISQRVAARFEELAHTSPSASVRLYLTSAVSRLKDPELGWRLLEALSKHGEDAGDANLPKMLWFALAPRMSIDPERALAVAESSPLPQLARYAHWYLATPGNVPGGLVLLTERLRQAQGKARRELLELAAHALSGERATADEAPIAWQEVSTELYNDADERVRHLAESIGASLGDASLFPKWRDVLEDKQASAKARRVALGLLRRSAQLSPDLLPVLLGLLDDEAFRSDVIPLLRTYEDPNIALALVSRFKAMKNFDQNLALDTLISRPSFARVLLGAIKTGDLSRAVLSAHHARQIGNLNDSETTGLLGDAWGKIAVSPEAVREEIAELTTLFEEAPLWAYSASAGKAHFDRLCAVCHQADGVGGRIGPDLTGAGRNGARYFLENVIDPNAVVGANYQMTVINASDGQTVAGMVEEESATTLTLRTVTDSVVLSKDKIVTRNALEQSLMPPGLLQPLLMREKIELLKYLTGL